MEGGEGEGDIQERGCSRRIGREAIETIKEATTSRHIHVCCTVHVYVCIYIHVYMPTHHMYSVQCYCMECLPKRAQSSTLLIGLTVHASR